MLNVFLGRRSLSSIRLVDPKEIQKKIESSSALHFPLNSLISRRTSILPGANKGG